MTHSYYTYFSTDSNALYMLFQLEAVAVAAVPAV